MTLIGNRKKMNTAGGSRTSGQALAEVVIAIGFLLAPLFLLLALVGKLIDLKMTTLEAARYAAFARTVTSNQSLVRGTTFDTLPDTSLAANTVMRFYSQSGVDTSLSNAQDSTSGYTPLSLWTDDNKTTGGGTTPEPFLAQSSDVTTTLSQAGSPFLSDSKVGNILSTTGSVTGFQWNTQGYFTATVQASATLPSSIGNFMGHDLKTYFDRPLTFDATTALMSDGESAPNSSYVYSQIQGTLVTSLLSSLQPVTSALGTVGIPDIGGLTLPQIVTNNPTELPCDRVPGAGCPP
jgi:hypothetical protein